MTGGTFLYISNNWSFHDTIDPVYPQEATRHTHHHNPLHFLSDTTALVYIRDCEELAKNTTLKQLHDQLSCYYNYHGILSSYT